MGAGGGGGAGGGAGEYHLVYQKQSLSTPYLCQAPFRKKFLLA